MCGIAGLLTQPGPLDTFRARLQAMGEALHHRGPDDAGQFIDAECGIGLAHRRLSIVDLSPLGHQPMASVSGRYVMVFNGEIYNFRALRRELELDGAAFRGHSDTEILLALIDRHGLADALTRCTGMFAIALWDQRARTLQLARDRFGEKPLYLSRLSDGWAFASELHALRRLPGFDRTLDRDALAQYLRHGYIMAPLSVFRGTRKVEPGTIVTIRSDGAHEVDRYWSVNDIAELGARNPLRLDDAEVVDMADQELRRAVRDQMLADVPLGAFLSGGVDSSLVVAVMQAQSTGRVRTFTVGFEEPEFNEAPHAEAVARHLGTDHTTLTVTAQDALQLIPRLPTIYDEPFGDASQVPTALVAALAKRHVTVALSGDGADELFAGYTRYARTQHHWERLTRIPATIRAAAAFSAPLLGTATARSAFTHLGLTARGYPAGRLQSALTLAGAPDEHAFYRTYVSQWRDPGALLEGTGDPAGAFGTSLPVHPGGALAGRMLRDQQAYLPDDILVKVDRACMAASLESRAPFLDHHLAALAWRLSPTQWERNGRGKWLLRAMLDRYVPSALVDRPKMGFGIPYGEWLRGPLRDWADDLLSVDRLQRDGIFVAQPVIDRWHEHRTGRFNWAPSLWFVLMFQAWLDADTGASGARCSKVA